VNEGDSAIQRLLLLVPGIYDDLLAERGETIKAVSSSKKATLHYDAT
jgi:hypothetical protein